MKGIVVTNFADVKIFIPTHRIASVVDMGDRVRIWEIDSREEYHSVRESFRTVVDLITGNKKE